MTRSQKAISRRPKAQVAAGPATSLSRAFRAAIVTRRAADRLRAGHLWVYASDVVEVAGENDLNAPGLIPVADQRGIPLGTALYSPASQIVLRLVSPKVLDTDAEWLALVEARLRRALTLRASMRTEACRLVFSEADELPGLIIDRYGPLLLVQLLARGLDRPEIRALVTRILIEEIAPETIVERGDARIAAIEALQTPALATLYAKDAANPQLQTSFLLNGLRFAYDAASGQKTGAFLDQRLNYAALFTRDGRGCVTQRARSGRAQPRSESIGAFRRSGLDRGGCV
jgi:23S rRNA (cytosine1962-C5)-methyltransferase